MNIMRSEAEIKKEFNRLLKKLKELKAKQEVDELQHVAGMLYGLRFALNYYGDDYLF